MSTTREMTRTEREDLKKLARERARVAKADAQRRTADLKAMFEKQLITIFDYNRDETWAAAVREAEVAVKGARESIARRCEELGIPPELAPIVEFSWVGRGPYAVMNKQGELRRAAYKQIEAMERTARHEIDRKALEIQTQLVADGLTSDRAIEFLSAMPSVDALMPEIEVGALDVGRRPALGLGDDLF